MDVLSHGLWGAIVFGRKRRRDFWLAFLFGMFPDLFSFGLYFFSLFFGLSGHPTFASSDHPADLVPDYVHYLYSWTHSLIIFSLIFALLWILFRKPVIASLAWPLHIVFDIFTHSDKYFPTPFLWPLSGFHINGIQWSTPIIFIPNVILLVAVYFWFFKMHHKHPHIFPYHVEGKKVSQRDSKR